MKGQLIRALAACNLPLLLVQGVGFRLLAWERSEVLARLVACRASCFSRACIRTVTADLVSLLPWANPGPLTHTTQSHIPCRGRGGAGWGYGVLWRPQFVLRIPRSPIGLHPPPTLPIAVRLTFTPTHAQPWLPTTPPAWGRRLGLEAPPSNHVKHTARASHASQLPRPR